MNFFGLSSADLLKWVPDGLYLKLCFKRRTGNKLDLKNPKTFNEKLQWLKLYNRNPEYTRMADKYEMKQYVTEKVGEGYTIPTLGVWNKFEDIDFDSLPNQFVLKCTHDSGGLVICRDKCTFDREKAKTKLNKSMKRNYYWTKREWPYKNIKPRIIAEEFIGDANLQTEQQETFEKCPKSISYANIQQQQGLLDYKFMCFDGVVRALFLDIGVIGGGEGHAEQYYRNIYDREGVLLPVKETRDNFPIPVDLPENLSAMVQIAETLSKGIPHIRIDLYRLSSGEIKVGELTFFHGSGLSNVFIPEKWDYTFGDWIKL